MSENNFLFLDEDDGEDTKNGRMRDDNDMSGSSESHKLQKDQRHFDRFRVSVFEVVCNLLKRGLEIQPWKIYALVFVEFIQLLQFSFHPSVSVVIDVITNHTCRSLANGETSTQITCQ